MGDFNLQKTDWENIQDFVLLYFHSEISKLELNEHFTFTDDNLISLNLQHLEQDLSSGYVALNDQLILVNWICICRVKSVKTYINIYRD